MKPEVLAAVLAQLEDCDTQAERIAVLQVAMTETTGVGARAPELRIVGRINSWSRETMIAIWSGREWLCPWGGTFSEDEQADLTAIAEGKTAEFARCEGGCRLVAQLLDR